MKASPRRDASLNQADDYAVLSQRILRYANRGVARIEFLTGISTVLLEFLQCDGVELRLRDPDLYYRWECTSKPKQSSQFTIMAQGQTERNPSKSQGRAASWETLCMEVMGGRFDPESPSFTKRGSFWTGEQPAFLPAVRRQDQPARSGPGRRKPPERTAPVEPYHSYALVPFHVDERTAGLLQLKSLQENCFNRRRVEFFERIAETLGLAIANRRAQWALRERVKELTCLYGIGRIAQLSEISLEEALQRTAELLPPAWQFPEIASARILLDRRAFTSPGFREGVHRQAADLTVNGKVRGRIEVVYTEERPEFAEGPFLAEERSLIDSVAREVALIVERRETEAAQAALQAQLRHADRLATIGQLAAGVAHELNEPLGSILGFAQLIQKESDLPSAAVNDLDRIVKAALRARQVIHKLLVFSRQKTPVKARVNLSHIVEEGLYFLESRCATAGIRLTLTLAPDLPEINADTSQLHQVLVNLVVNSMQAMPQGGTLTIATRTDRKYVWLSVQDTGLGISDEIKEKIFTPFFTTKDVDQGTGLGLAVVHGIVTSHGGSIHVESAPGQGARFEIQLPAAEDYA